MAALSPSPAAGNPESKEKSGARFPPADAWSPRGLQEQQGREPVALHTFPCDNK